VGLSIAANGKWAAANCAVPPTASAGVYATQVPHIRSLADDAHYK